MADNGHLFKSSDNEAQSREHVEVGRSCRGTADDCLNDKRRYKRFLSTELVREKPEQDGAEHDAKVEYHLRGFRQHVPVADKVPLREKHKENTKKNYKWLYRKDSI